MARCICRVVSSQGRSSLGYLRPYRRIIVAGVVSLIATNACFLGVAIALRDGVQALKDAREIQTITDWLQTFQGTPSYTDAVVQWRHASVAVAHHAAVHAVVMLVAYATATAITRIFSRVWIFNAARAAEYDLRSDLFGHALALAPSYYRDHPTGDVMSRLTNDVQVVRAMWGAGLVHLSNAVTSFATVLPLMLGMSWKGQPGSKWTLETNWPVGSVIRPPGTGVALD